MKRLLIIALAAIGMVACTQESSEIIDNKQTIPAEYISLIDTQNGEIDDKALIAALTTRGMHISNGKDYRYDKEQESWEEVLPLRGEARSVKGIVFEEDGSCYAVMTDDIYGVQMGRYLDSRGYDCLYSSYSYDTESNTLYTTAEDGVTQFEAKVVYYSGNTLILDGMIFGINCFHKAVTPDERFLVKYELDEPTRENAYTLRTRIENPNIEVEEIVAKQSGEIDDDSLMAAIVASEMDIALELCYDPATERWIDVWDILPFKNYVWRFSDTETSVVGTGDIATTSYRYEAETNTLYTTGTHSKREYAAKVIYWDSDMIVLDGGAFLYEVDSNGTDHRYRVVARF